MILQALAEYYDRKTAVPNAGLATIGFEAKEIPFVLEINTQGELIQIEDTREGDGRKKRARSFLVPQGIKKTSGVASNLLWDNAEYVIGLLNVTKFQAIPKSNRAKRKKQLQRFREQHQAFVSRVNELSDSVDDIGLSAVGLFLTAIKENKSMMRKFPQWTEIVENNPNLTFRLSGCRELVCQSASVIAAVQSSASSDVSQEHCLISGELDEVERLHTSIKGVWGAQSSGANVVSFNLDAFNSYAKKQGNNAPVGKQAAFAYTTALNYLLRKDSTQRMQVGDASTVFWAVADDKRQSQSAEQLFVEIVNPSDDSEAIQLKSLIEKISQGRPLKEVAPDIDLKTRFYLLGLAPNASRLSIRYWLDTSFGELAQRMAEHFTDLSLDPLPWNQPPSIWRLLIELVPYRSGQKANSKEIPPHMAGEIMRSILTGDRYPHSLLSQLVLRIRSDGHISPLRVAMIKAVLHRDHRKINKEDTPMSLDECNDNDAYLLGRLFAVLERIQFSAVKGANATITDRYFGSASTVPFSVFPRLLAGSKNHLAKIRKKTPGFAVNLDKELTTIIGKLPAGFPKHFSIDSQGRFTIGYYHQREKHFSSSNSDTQQENT